MDIDEENMLKLVTKLDKFFSSSNAHNLAAVEFPKEIEYKSSAWLYYVFYSCLLDYGMKSKLYHANLIATYHNHKEIFSPKYVLANFAQDFDGLYCIIRENIHPHYPNVATKKWIRLSSKLNKYTYLLEYIEHFKTVDELEKFIKNIGGFGQKTGGLLLRLISDSNLCHFNDSLSSIPLDRHDIEISYLNHIIDTPKLNSKDITKLSTSYVECGNKMNIKPSKIDKYLWEIGNRFCNKKNCTNCPLYEDCATKIESNL